MIDGITFTVVTISNSYWQIRRYSKCGLNIIMNAMRRLRIGACKTALDVASITDDNVMIGLSGYCLIRSSPIKPPEGFSPWL